MIPKEEILLKMLSNHDVTFFIPPYQRNYEWTKEQCEAFYKDVKKTYKNNMHGKNDEHFFGAITFFSDETPFGEPDKLVLIDGQQRITTTMLFLLAIRDLADENKNLKSTIDNNYLKNEKSVDNSEHKIKLKQVETDWDAYRALVLGEELTKTQKNSCVYQNYTYFTKRLTKFKKDKHELGDLIEKGLNKFRVVSIQLEPERNPWENPQEIFESMNSIGKPLSLADLVRNFLLLGKSAGEQTELYNKYWLKIEKEIPGEVSSFIRDFMQMKEGQSFNQAKESNYKLLYSQFKDLYKKRSNSLEFFEELKADSKIFAEAKFLKETESKEINRILSDLNVLKITTANSFIMSILKAWRESRLSEFEVAVMLNVLENYFLRRRILGITSAENKVLPTLANYIDEAIEWQDKKMFMFSILSSLENSARFPNDLEISNHLETMNFYNFRYCKFYLSLIEEKITKIRPDVSNSQIQIEHIMPQTLNDTWKTSLGDNCEEIHAQYVNTIGNLTLIQFNQELGNKPFANKKEVYENRAGLQIAKTEITNRDVWDEEAIINRQIWISDFMLDNVFPLPEGMKKANNYRSKETTRSKNFSFKNVGLIGREIKFTEDDSIRAKVVSDREVEFEGKKWKLSPLTRELFKRKGNVRASGSFRGPLYWEYNGILLTELNS